MLQYCIIDTIDIIVAKYKKQSATFNPTNSNGKLLKKWEYSEDLTEINANNVDEKILVISKELVFSTWWY